MKFLNKILLWALFFSIGGFLGYGFIAIAAGIW